jgi:vacuolar iron transporter family protein
MTDTSSPEIHHEHRDVTGGWLRPSVFGMMDGLVSNFALLAGFSGGHATHRVLVLAGLAGLVAGAASMATGEFVSVQSQNESARAEIEIERRELRVNADAELAELAGSFEARGVDPELAAEVARQLSRDPDQALLIHAQSELGVDPRQLPSPITAAVSSLVSFSAGAMISLLPYLFGTTSVLASAILSLAALFASGAVISRFTARGWVYSGARLVLCGAAAAAVTFAIGAAFHVGSA